MYVFTVNSIENKDNSTPANRGQARFYVGIQFLILFLLIFFSNNVGYQLSILRSIGTIFEIVGLLGFLLSANILRGSLTAIPIPKPDGKLSTNGLYKYVRHPMYTSVLLLTVGIALRSGSLIKYFLVIALALLFYSKSIYEERYLFQKYPEYGQYLESVPRFIPFTKSR